MAAPTLVASAYANGSGTSLNVTAPASISSGDLLIAISASNSFRTDFDLNAPTGFTEYAATGSSLNDVHMLLSYKIADGTESSSTITFTSNNSHTIWAGVLHITGHDPDIPIGSIFKYSSTSTAGTTHTLKCVTSRDDALAILAFAPRNNGNCTIATTIGTWTEDEDTATAGISRLVASQVFSTAGSHGSFDITSPSATAGGIVFEIMAKPVGTITTSNHASVSATTGSPRIYSGVSIGGNPHTVYCFYQSGSITLSSSVTNVIRLLQGGGASGGQNTYYGGGGGGGGETLAVAASTLASGTHTVTVGLGGADSGTSASAANGNRGGDTTFDSATALGGGYGAGNGAGDGYGTGGGGGGANSGGTATGTGGNGGAGSGSGWRGGGGGGGSTGNGEAAGGTSAAFEGGAGGAGTASEILGLTTYFGGGGGAGGYSAGNANIGDVGGVGGGGYGGDYSARTQRGVDGLGGGGGGRSNAAEAITDMANDGGDGVVIIALPESSGPAPLAADTGSFTLSGQTTDLLRGLIAGQDAGSFTLSGQDAGFARGLVLPAADLNFGSYPPVRSSYVEDGNATSITIDPPAGAQSGDLMVLITFCRSTPTTPSGWTKELETSVTSLSSRVCVYTKTHTGSEGTITFTQASSARIGALVLTAPATGSIFGLSANTSAQTAMPVPALDGHPSEYALGVMVMFSDYHNATQDERSYLSEPALKLGQPTMFSADETRLNAWLRIMPPGEGLPDGIIAHRESVEVVPSAIEVARTVSFGIPIGGGT